MVATGALIAGSTIGYVATKLWQVRRGLQSGGRDHSWRFPRRRVDPQLDPRRRDTGITVEDFQLVGEASELDLRWSTTSVEDLCSVRLLRPLPEASERSWSEVRSVCLLMLS